MARILWQGQRRPQLYEMGERFANEALKRDSSLFTPRRPVWSGRVLDELHERFVVGADWGAGDFESKSQGQLAGAPDEVVQLLAELTYFNLLTAVDMKPQTKRERIEFFLELMNEPVSVPDELQAGFEVGIARLGAGKSQRYWQLVYLIELIRTWKRLPESEQRPLLDDPWAFKAFAAEQEAFRAGSQREALLHLLFPDTFESVIAEAHKRKIVKTFEDLLSEPTDDVDRALLEIRSQLEERFGADFHFYEPEVKELWQPAKASPWDQLARWAAKVVGTARFDELERDYKLEFAEQLGKVR